jgi:O-antigen ligase
MVVVLSLSQYGGLLTERVFGQTSNIDANEASSGRTEIWVNLFATMLQHPITFLTGYGWEVYWSFPFRFSPHNHYFSLWFNLGLVGLFSGSYLLFSSIGRAKRASMAAEPGARRQLVAYVIGVISVCGAVFFVELHDPWVYFWMYAGTVMRLAMCVQPVTAQVPALEPESDQRWRLRAAHALPRDNYGWAAQGRRG